MQTNAFPLWRVGAVTFFLAALAALSATYWVLKGMQGHSVSATTPVANAGPAALDPQALARALGGGQSAMSGVPGPAVASVRTPYVLMGVLADSTKGGAALISVDGKPAKPFSVGAMVDGNLVLQSVSGRHAVLADSAQGSAPITLDMPPLSK
ncbi:MAG: general secretion pathway protein C [Burkholderiales bacterium]|nr:general secretion pathway protein C [Burkholderiales bacterium]